MNVDAREKFAALIAETSPEELFVLGALWSRALSHLSPGRAARLTLGHGGDHAQSHLETAFLWECLRAHPQLSGEKMLRRAISGARVLAASCSEQRNPLRTELSEAVLAELRAGAGASRPPLTPELTVIVCLLVQEDAASPPTPLRELLDVAQCSVADVAQHQRAEALECV